MRALVYADVHADDGNELCFCHQGWSLQHWRVKKFFADAFKLYQQYKCDCVWDLGDTTNSRCSIPIPTIDVVLEGVSKFPPHPWNLKLIGNHEQFLRSTSVHVGRLFQQNFQIVEEAKVLQADGVVYALCPFPAEDAQLEAWLEAVLEDYPGKPKILLGHFQVLGCKLNSGEAKDGVSKEVLRHFDLGLLGHVHKPQTLVGNVHYVGSPFQQDRGEEGEVKRVAIVDTDKLSVQWVKLDGFPEYKTRTLAQFLTEVNERSEDRFQVILANPAEAERFFAHPLSSRASPVYRYDVKEEVNAGRELKVESWLSSRRGLVRKYFELNPPAERGINMPLEELEKLAEHFMDAED
jgi:hypothetical protein